MTDKKMAGYYSETAYSTLPFTLSSSTCAPNAPNINSPICATAAASDPNKFAVNGFTLRQVHYDPPWHGAPYRPDHIQTKTKNICRMMRGGVEEYRHLCKRDRRVKEGWKKVVE